MRYVLPLSLLVSITAIAPAHAADLAPFAAPAVSDGELAQAYAGDASGALAEWRMTDAIFGSAERQTAALGPVIRDIWTMEVAEPLIVANIVRNQGLEPIGR